MFVIYLFDSKYFEVRCTYFWQRSTAMNTSKRLSLTSLDMDDFKLNVQRTLCDVYRTEHLHNSLSSNPVSVSFQR